MNSEHLSHHFREMEWFIMEKIHVGGWYQVEPNSSDNVVTIVQNRGSIVPSYSISMTRESILMLPWRLTLGNPESEISLRLGGGWWLLKEVEMGTNGTDTFFPYLSRRLALFLPPLRKQTWSFQYRKSLVVIDLQLGSLSPFSVDLIEFEESGDSIPKNSKEDIEIA